MLKEVAMQWKDFELETGRQDTIYVIMTQVLTEKEIETAAISRDILTIHTLQKIPNFTNVIRK